VDKLSAAIEEYRGYDPGEMTDLFAKILEKFEMDSEEFAVAWGKELGKDTSDPEALEEEIYAILAQPETPLRGKYRELTQKEVLDGCLGNNGNAWLSDHQHVVAAYFLSGGLTEVSKGVLGEFPDYIMEEEVGGIKISSWQYVEAAEEVIASQAKKMQKDGLPEAFANAYWSLSEGRGPETFESLLVKHVTEHPENKDDAWKGLLLVVEQGFLDLEQLLSSWVVKNFKEQVVKNLKMFDDEWRKDEPEGVDYSVYGNEVEMMFLEAGFGKPEQTTPESIAQAKAEHQAKLEANRIEIASYTPSEVGMSRENYLAAYRAGLAGKEDKTGIINAIKTLKLPPRSNRKLQVYVEQRIESPTSPVGEKLNKATEGTEVLNLIKGLFQSGRYNSVELPEESDAQATVEKEEVQISFEGKRVCVTGKLSLTRTEIEDKLKAAGATIASGVSKTTDYLIVGEDAGSKLTKAQELGVVVLTEEQAIKSLKN